MVLGVVVILLALAFTAWWFMYRSLGHGATFGTVDDLGQAGKQLAHVACGSAAKLDQPGAGGGCNLEAGDTSCRAQLPVLCTLSAPLETPVVADGPLKGWANTRVGATHAVAGTSLSSAEASDKLCQADLGAGWQALRASGIHPSGLRSFRAKGLEGPDPQGARYWVATGSESAGNCWNAAK